MAGISNTSRTLKFLREEGYVCDIVEKWVSAPWHPSGGFRRDYLNFLDIIAINEEETVGVQSCGQNFSEHNRKIISNEHAPLWVRPHHRSLWLIGWRKVKLKRGGKAMRWRPRIKEYTVEDFKEIEDNLVIFK